MKSIYKCLNTKMEAWEFCKNWLKPSPEEEDTKTYKGKCNRLLKEALGMESDEGIKRWGKRYEKMPPQHKVTLSYLDSLRRISEIASKCKAIDEILSKTKE